VGSKEKRKGKVGERAVARMFREAGYHDARRNLDDVHGEQGVDVMAGPFLIQVKRYKSSVPMNKYDEIMLDNGIKLLVTKVDYKPWMVTLRLDDFLEILQDIGVAWRNE
jgi:hypothetical protein